MPEHNLRVIDGPDKPALQWALAYPDREEVHFKLEDDSADASILRMDETADGLSFELEGILTSGLYKKYAVHRLLQRRFKIRPDHSCRVSALASLGRADRKSFEGMLGYGLFS